MKSRFITKIQNLIIKSTVIRFCVVLFLITSFAHSAFSQSGATNRGFTPGNSFAISDFEAINMTNGNMMMKFPLAQLPVGRNGLTTGLFLVYNSKLYDMETQYFENYGQYCANPGGCYYQKRVLKHAPEGGWKFSSGYGLSGDNRLAQYSGLPNSQYPQCRDPYGGVTEFYQEMTYIHKLYVTYPDGSKHEMIPYSNNDALGDRYYDVRPDGVRENCGGGQLRTGYPMTYYSIDGTYLRLEFSYDNDFDPSNNTWTLHFPDGSYYFSGRAVNYQMVEPARFYDRNNNYIEFGTQVTDQFGRTLVSGGGIDPVTGENLITVKGVGGEDMTWRIKWKSIFVNKHYSPYTADIFPNCSRTATCPPTTDPEPANMWLSMVEKITLPSQAGNNLSYTFSYNAHDSLQPPTNQSVGFGELSGVTMPSGAHVSYSYFLDNSTDPLLTGGTTEILKNRIVGKTLTYNREYDGTTTPVTETWGYYIDSGGSIITGPDGSVTSETVGYTESEHPLTGLSLRSLSPDGTMVEKLWMQNIPIAPLGSLWQRQFNPLVKTEFTSVKDKNGNYTLTAIKDYNYDKNGNVTEVREYDWVPYSSVPRSSQMEGNYPTGIPYGITPKRITSTAYWVYNPDASVNPGTNPQLYQFPNLYVWRAAPRLRNAAASVEVKDDQSQVVSRSEMFYDNPLTTGNLTESKSWDSTKGAYTSILTAGNSISAFTTYNQYGMPVTTTDARGTVTQITYGNVQGPNGNVTDLYPTQTITAYGTSVQKTTQMEYDFYTGVVKRVIDVDNNVSTSTTYDAFGRPTLVKSAEGTATETRTRTIYNDADRRVIVKSDLNTMGDEKRVAIQHYDQLGRVRLSRTLEDSTTQSATNEQHGIKVQTRYAFSENYSYVLASNPYRAATSSAATNETTMGWSRSKTNNKGQLIESETFSGAILPAPFGSNSNSTGVLKTDYDANVTRVTDQTGKHRKSEINALGQLVKVIEDPSITGYTGLDYETTYSYDTLGNLIKVNQGVQQRFFMYSSLSRLLRAKNPETDTNANLNHSDPLTGNSQWSIAYTYDNGGNLLAKVDARNITTTYTYDALSRILTRNYSDNITPTVTYTYDDTNVTLGIGKLTKVSSSLNGNVVSAYEYTSFDALGRILSTKQTTNGTAYAMSYTYNLAGGTLSQTYPSGRVVTNSFGNDASLTNVSSKANSNAISRTYANSFIYAPSGAIQSLRLGNGRYESTQFNSRLQPVQIALGASSTNADLLKLNFTYGVRDSQGNLDETKNNGNVESQTITVPSVGSNQGFTAVQNYSYDQLNRLIEAKETSNSQQQWIQTLIYDRYGNRRIDSAQNKTTTGLVGPNPTISESTNRIVAQSGEHYHYDSAGNLDTDKDNNVYVYDGENKLVTYNGGAANGGANYIYDGDGRRVKKIVNTETTIFVYNAAGQVVAEYSTTPSANPTTSYLTSDNLGTPRINTDTSGQTTARHDYLPFGEEIIAGQSYSGGRTTQLRYVADDVKRKFSGKERDSETGLDYSINRYYSPLQGRFTTTDPTLKSARPNMPQSWNRYTYVLNNPLLFIDPLGLWEIEAVPVKKKVKKDGKDVEVIDHYQLVAKKTQGSKDTAERLAQQLGLKGDAAKQLIKSVGNGDNIRLKDVGGAVGEKAGKMEFYMQLQANFQNENPGSRGGPSSVSGRPDARLDCTQAAWNLGFNASKFAVGLDGFDSMLDGKEPGYSANSVAGSDTQIGDFVRWGNEGNKTTHVATFLYTDDNGKPVVFSKTGQDGPYEVKTFDNLTPTTTDYGSIKGKQKGTSGFYRPVKP